MLDGSPIPDGILIFLVGAALYISDSARLLYVNDLLFIRGRSGMWTVRFAKSFPFFASRFLAIPNPLNPQHTMIVSAWPDSQSVSEEGESQLQTSVETTISALKIPRGYSIVLFLTIFLCLPLLYWAIGPSAFLAGVLITYVLVLSLVVWIVRNGPKLGLLKSQIIKLSFECLVCLPFSINAYRKVASQLLPLNIDPLMLGDALLEDENRRSFLEEISNCVQQKLDWTETESRAYAALKQFQSRVESRRPT